MLSCNFLLARFLYIFLGFLYIFQIIRVFIMYSFINRTVFTFFGVFPWDTEWVKRTEKLLIIRFAILSEISFRSHSFTNFLSWNIHLVFQADFIFWFTNKSNGCSDLVELGAKEMPELFLFLFEEILFSAKSWSLLL